MEQPYPRFRTSFGQDIFFNKYAHEEAGKESYKNLVTVSVKRKKANAKLRELQSTEGSGESRRNIEIAGIKADLKKINQEYADACLTHWIDLSKQLVTEVVQDDIPEEDKNDIIDLMRNMQFLPAGRYLYYAGRPIRAYNNCYLFKAEEDTREEWGKLVHRSSDALMSGGGIGIDYSKLRHRGARLKRTGGVASGPIPLMEAINEYGRRVQQGGSRRSAIYASLNWKHKDAKEFLHIKDWYDKLIPGTNITYGEAKENDFNAEAPLDMTNISLNYDNDFLTEVYDMPMESLLNVYENEGMEGIMQLPIVTIPDTFLENCKQALKTGEPGFSFNFFQWVEETLRNACTEVTSSDDSDVCNLGSLNMSRFHDIEEWRKAVRQSTYFLLCGTLRADLPTEKIKEVRAKNRRLGLGIMGVHEWLMMRGYNYRVVDELHEWLKVWKEESDKAAYELADKLGISRPVGVRAIAPTGTIGILAGTTTGIEPLFAVAFKRRFLKDGVDWHYQYVIDGTAKVLINQYDIKPDSIETALELASDPERRIKFQYDVQAYVDQAISSTINLPAWNSDLNNEGTVTSFAKTLIKYAHGLRGFTVYPDGARGGQPLTSVPYYEAIQHEGEEFREEAVDICDLTKGGTCGS